MRKTTNTETDKKITVDITELQKMLSVGKNTASEIGKAAGASLTVGRRRLYLVDKIAEYMETLCE